MTLISHRAGFIFLKTHKTASTSVEVALEGLCAPPGALTGKHYRPMAVSPDGIIGARGKASAGAQWRNHMSARAVRKGIGRDIWNQYSKITTVRNPYDRMVSMFHSRMTPLERTEIADVPFDEVRTRFLNFLRAAGPSNNMNKLTLNTRYIVDYVIYYENLAVEFAALAQALGLKETSLPRLKSDRRARSEPVRDYYTEEAKRIVAAGAAFELAYFGYDFGSGPVPPPRYQRLKKLMVGSPLHIGNVFFGPQKRLKKHPFRP